MCSDNNYCYMLCALGAWKIGINVGSDQACFFFVGVKVLAKHGSLGSAWQGSYSLVTTSDKRTL